MAYTALRLDVPGEDAEAWSDALLEAGALSVEVSDPAEGTAGEQAVYAEPGIASGHWEHARVVALLADDADADAMLAEAAASLRRDVPSCQRSRIAEQDWVRATQAQFGPITVGGRLAIVPTWCEPPPAVVSIRLDPGLAFGTGSHPTTRLCLEWMLEHLEPGASVLDYGCGSGILAIAAAKLGASRVVGTDVDAQALRASRDNAASNGIDATFVAPDALAPGAFDVVVANILANPLMLLAPAIAARVRAGGSLALSGILADQADDVIAAYRGWFTLGASREADGWVVIAGTRTAD